MKFWTTVFNWDQIEQYPADLDLAVCTIDYILVIEQSYQSRNNILNMVVL